MSLIDRMPRRLRHESRVRQLQVTAVSRITPKLARVSLGGPALKGFSSPGFDDHIKLFFAPPGAELVLPVISDNGFEFPRSAPHPEIRNYTPRRFDPATLTLDIDFVLHGDGPAARFGAEAAIGQTLSISGPRGSMIIPDAFDWYLLAGDETALPAIGRRLEELPAGAKALAVIEVDSPGEEQPFDTSAEATIIWAYRHGAAAGTGTALLSAVAAEKFPPGDPFAFVAAEAGVAKAVRRHLVEDRQLAADCIKAAGYWLLGAAGTPEPL